MVLRLILKKRADGFQTERETDEREANAYNKGADNYLMKRVRIFSRGC